MGQNPHPTQNLKNKLVSATEYFAYLTINYIYWSIWLYIHPSISNFFLCCWDGMLKTYNSWRKVFSWLKDYGPPPRKIKTGIQSSGLKEKLWMDTPYWVFSATFYMRPWSLGMTSPTVGCNSRKCLRHVHKLIGWKHFFIWDSLFPSTFRFVSSCQQKLTVI